MNKKIESCFKMALVVMHVVSSVEVSSFEFSGSFKSSKRFLCSRNEGRLFGKDSRWNSPICSSLVANHAGDVVLSSEQKVYDVVLKQAALVKQHRRPNAVDVKPDIVVPGTMYLLKEAYDRCGEVCAEYAKTFYLG